MNSNNAHWLDDSREIDRLIAEARQMRADAMAHYFGLAFAAVKNGVVALLAPFRQWQERSALDSELRGMSDMELRDIGLSRSDIDQVVNGSYRDERGQRAPRRRRPILVHAGQPKAAPTPTEKPKAA